MYEVSRRRQVRRWGLLGRLGESMFVVLAGEVYEGGCEAWSRRDSLDGNFFVDLQTIFITTSKQVDVDSNSVQQIQGRLLNIIYFHFILDPGN